MTAKDDERRLPIRTLILRVRSEQAAMQFRFAALKLCFALEGYDLRAYNPNQPRVPAGNADGGQWTDGGFHLLKPRHDPGRSEDEERVRVAGGRATFDPVIRIGNYWLGATPAQQVRLAASQAQASMAIAQIRTIDPTWRPGPGVSSSGVEGAIARNEATAREAYARLSELGRPPPIAQSSRDIFFPGGHPIGVREGGAHYNVRTVATPQLRELLGEVLIDARPVSTPANYAGQWYRRLDGSTIGLRFSGDHGLTVDAIRTSLSPAYRPIKVHAK